METPCDKFYTSARKRRIYRHQHVPSVCLSVRTWRPARLTHGVLAMILLPVVGHCTPMLQVQCFLLLGRMAKVPSECVAGRSGWLRRTDCMVQRVGRTTTQPCKTVVHNVRRCAHVNYVTSYQYLRSISSDEDYNDILFFTPHCRPFRRGRSWGAAHDVSTLTLFDLRHAAARQHRIVEH